MRVLYVISDENIGGAGIQLCNLLRYMDREEVTPTVALPKGSLLQKRIRELDVPTYELKHPCHRPMLSSMVELMGVIRKERADIVHANAAISARLAGKLCHRPVVFTRHCYYPVTCGSTPREQLSRRVNNLLCDRAVATALPAAENLMQLGVPREKIRLIVNGSEAVREVSDAELQEWRTRLSLTREDLCVGLCARLERCKGADVFLRGAAEVMNRMPHRRFRFLLVGEGSERANLEDLARELGIEDAVRFVGFVEDPAPLYRLMRIHTNCSRGTETSSLSISEGMSAGLPTVVSAYGGNRAMIGNGEAGLCFAVGDAKALASAICRIAADPSLERRMGEAALWRYRECFTPERMARQTSHLYRSLV